VLKLYRQNTDDNIYTGFRGFTQTNTQATSTPSSNRVELRHRTIAFISAGTSTPPIELKHQIANGSSEDSEDMDEDNEDSTIITNIITDIDATVPNHSMAEMILEDREVKMDIDKEQSHHTRIASVNNAESAETSIHIEAPLFIVDTAGDETLVRPSKVRHDVPIRRSPSPARSDSSEEQVVFHGRGRTKIVNDPLHVSNKTVTAGAFEVADRLESNTATSIAFGVGPGKLAKDATKESQGFTPAPSGSWWRNHAPGEKQPTLETAMATSSKQPTLTPQQKLNLPVRETKMTRDKDAEDVISSLLQCEKNATNKNHELQAQENGNARTSKRRGKKGRKKGNRALRTALDSDEDDDGAEAAYDDYMANLAAQLAQEEQEEQQTGDSSGTVSGMLAFARTAGLEGPSLVVDGRIIPDDEVLPRKLKMSKDDDKSKDASEDSAWVSDGSDVPENFDSEDSDEGQSELEDEIEYNQSQMYDDEDDLRRRRIERMEDEKLARLFAKQAEWGIDADELIIEDGDFDDGIGDLEAAQLGLADIGKLTFGSTPSKRSRRGGKREPHRFVDATALADSLDQYGNNGFDIMDFDRPSLRPLKKGRKGKIPAALEAISDDELREVTMASWDNDREKKRLKKLEREEQRKDGLLGKAARTGREDLKAKYSTGITIKQCLDELYAFLLEVDLEQRAFPPMDKADRKALHEICTRLHLNSKSQGAGKHRFPMITKTQRTPCPGDAEFDAFVEIARSGTIATHGQVYKLKNALARKGRAARTVGGGRGGGGGSHAPRNGEIVGASASKIGSDSFGHRMMQKMGWQEGKGLGQSGEGLINPVEQRMRFGTAGLG
jgi:hypothetical protein